MVADDFYIRYNVNEVKKEYLIIVVALIILGIGAFFSSRNMSGGDDQGSVSSEGNNVVYTNSGFSPQTLTVGVGTTIVFTNQSDNQMWVASDPHPVHTNHPAFDQVGDEDTYSFTFTEIGTYNYHNHLIPSNVGMIIVE